MTVYGKPEFVQVMIRPDDTFPSVTIWFTIEGHEHSEKAYGSYFIPGDGVSVDDVKLFTFKLVDGASG